MQDLNSIEVPNSSSLGPLRVTAGAVTAQGVRRAKNEDNHYVSPEMDLFVVADGIGGHSAGEVASRFAVEVLSQDLARLNVEIGDDDVQDRVRSALERLQCLIIDTATENPVLAGASTTVVMGLLLKHRLYVAGVGDSRAYLIRGGEIDRLTIDDTWPDVMYHMGKISADDASRHGMRNMLLAALGMKDFRADHEEVKIVEVYSGDTFLFASDGLTGVVEEQRILELAQLFADPQDAAEALLQEAIQNGAGDDITCVLLNITNE
jgi:serine/threonine protein phosphatase PrpC